MRKKSNDLLITCGVIVTDTRSYLICHPTMSKWWDIPKGQMDPGETPVGTALRELQEETGIVVDPSAISYIGQYDYKKNKQLILFYHQVDIMYNPSIMTCVTTFQRKGKTFPEMDQFQVVNRDQMLKKVNPSLAKVLEKLV